MKPLQLPAIESEYYELLRVAALAATAGGQKLIEWRGKFETREKSPADLVTDADEAAQRAIFDVIAENFPEHALLGEEDPGEVSALLEQPVCWVVDPLDGTTNYVHGFPAYAVSIAAVVEGEIVVGLIFDPLRERDYMAVKGGGAWCGGKRLRTSDTTELESALIAMSLPATVERESRDLKDFLAIVGRCQGVRRTGSAALSLAYVAEGVLDGHWARIIKPWDVAAGVLLVREAGGEVAASTGDAFDLGNPHFAAAGNPQLHAQLLAALAGSGGSGD